MELGIVENEIIQTSTLLTQQIPKIMVALWYVDSIEFRPMGWSSASINLRLPWKEAWLEASL